MRRLILFLAAFVVLQPLIINAQTLIAHYDVTDAPTVHTSGSTVTQLDDKSGSTNTLTATGTGICVYHPGGLSYINFPDNTIRLQSTAIAAVVQPYTVYMVVRQNSFQNGAALATFNTTDPGGGGINQNNEAGIQTVVPYAGPINNDDKRNKIPNLYSTGWRLLKFVFNGSQSYETLNGGARLLSYLFPNPDPNPVPNPSTFAFLPGTNTLTSISIGGGANLDFSEMQIFDGILSNATAAAVEQALMDKYGLQPVTGIKGFGDSNTVGLGAAAPQDFNNWMFLLASAKGKPFYNYGINQSFLFGRDDINHPGHNLYGFTTTRVLGAYGPADYCFFSYGTNDVVVGIDELWKNNYKSFIQESFIDMGYSTQKSKLIICSPPHVANATFGLVRDYCSQVAAELGIQFADLYTQLNNTGNASAYMEADGIHLNGVGHAFAADYYKTFIDNSSVPSSNTDLSSLTLSAGTMTPAFASGTTAYIASVTNNITAVTVTPAVADPTSTVKVNGTPVTSGNASGSIALSEGSNIISIVVTAQNGTTTKPYIFNVRRAPLSSVITFSGKVFLQGPFNAGTGTMTNLLNTSGILQANASTQPYNITGFNYTGTENVAGGFFAGHPEIVDWVLVELREASTPGTVVARRAAFLKQDGSLLETDGQSDHIIFQGVLPGGYYVVIRHRNHLSIRSSVTIDFNSGSGNYDFTTAVTKAFAGSVSNPSMATLATGVYGMYAGNTNADLTIRKTGSATVNDYSLLLNAVSGAAPPGPTGVYRNEDVNMDGNVRRTGSASTNDYSKLFSILGPFNIISQPLF